MGFTIAIDGPAAAGKGTIARQISTEFGFAHLDTGLLYRAVGAKMLAGVKPIEAALALQASDLQGDLRNADVARAASKVAAIPEVRQALFDFQRAFAARSGGAVLDGRDIGTVICPEAQVKLFVTASPEVRAARRLLELLNNGADTNYETVLADVKERDHRDSSRPDAPMKPAEDAVVLDTSDLSIDEALKRSIALIRERQSA